VSDGVEIETSRGRAMKSGEGLDCISLTSCRIRFTAGLLRLYLAVAAITSSSGNPLSSPPPPTGARVGLGQPSNWESKRREKERERGREDETREVAEDRGGYILYNTN